MEYRTKEFLEKVKTNPFSVTNNNSITLDFKRVPEGFHSYRLDASESNLHPDEFIKRFTPVFQRENTKWSRDMQIRFVENVLAGCPTNILVYSAESESEVLDNCYLLDGLQRITAINDFIQGRFKIYSDFSYQEIPRRICLSNSRITVKFYHFKDHYEACQFYIDMNKHITHSEQDLEVAYTFMKNQDKLRGQEMIADAHG